MQEPKISVCLITYNQEAYISKALESVLSQKTKYNFEFIIGEDGSSDGTSDICRKYAKDFPDTIKLIERDRNCPERKKYSCQSLYNFIHTIKEAQGKYVMIIEGDDYWTAPYKLQKQVDFMEANPDFTMCVHPAEVKYESCDWTQEQIKDLDSTVPPTNLHNLFCTNNEIPLKYMLQSNCIATASAMYRWKYYGEEFQKAFPLHIMPGDWYLHLLHARDGKIGYLPDSMSVYRKHSGGIYSSLGKDMGYFYDKFGMLELNFYHAVMQLFPEDSDAFAIVRNTYENYVFSMVETLLKNSNFKKLEKFDLKYPGELVRLLHKGYFRTAPNSFLERLGRVMAKIGMKDGGLRHFIRYLRANRLN